MPRWYSNYCCHILQKSGHHVLYIGQDVIFYYYHHLDLGSLYHPGVTERRRALISTTVVRQCSKDDDASQLRRVKIDPRHPKRLNQSTLKSVSVIITFCVSRRRRKMYCGHARLCVCLSVCLCVCLSAAVRPHYCTDTDVTWGRGRGCP